MQADSAEDLSGSVLEGRDSAFDDIHVKLLEGAVHNCQTCGPPLCPNEQGRIDTFLACGLQSSMEPCTELDVVLQAACRVFSTPYASLALYFNKTCRLVNTVREARSSGSMFRVFVYQAWTASVLLV